MHYNMNARNLEYTNGNADLCHFALTTNKTTKKKENKKNYNN
jgi:hypothetical protein